MDELELLRRHRPDVPPPGREARTRAETVLAAAQAAEARPAGRRAAGRTWALAAAAALCTAVVVLVIGGGPATTAGTLTAGPLAPATAAADVVRAVEEEGWIELRFIEPAADEQRIRDEIRALGLDLEVRFSPVSPSLEWQVTALADTGGIEYLVPEAGSGGTFAIRLLPEYDGGAVLGIGRPARPGEAYASSPANGAEMPGEALHCSGIGRLRVDEAQAVAAQRGLAVEWRVRDGRTVDPATIADWYVDGAIPWAAGEVLLWAAPTPPPVLPAVEQAIRAGCEAAGAGAAG